MTRTWLTAATITALTVLGGCGGGDDTSSTGDGDVVAAPDATPAGEAAAATLADVDAAIESTGYTCSPAEFTMTPSVGSACLTTSSILVASFAWEDAATATNFGRVENACLPESGLGELLVLEGETWAVRAAVFGEPTADRLDEITGVLEAIRANLGGTIATIPCA